LLFFLALFALLGSLLTAVAPNFAVLFAARALVGLSAFAILPTSLSLLADLYAPEQRGRAGMAMLTAQFGGVAAVFAVGGVLLANAGADADSWRRAMFWLTAPPLALVTLAMLALREPPRSGRVIESPSMRQSFLAFWEYRAVIAPILGGKVLAQIALQSVLIWTAPTLARTFSLQPDRVGAIVAVLVPVGGMAGTVAGGMLADLCQRAGGPRRTVLVASVLAALSAPVSYFFVEMPGVLPMSALLTALVAILTALATIATTLFMIAVPNEIRGLCIGVMTGIGVALATGLGPLLVSGLSGLIGGPAMIGRSLSIVCLASGTLCAASFALGRRSC
jgi:MFS family permease